MVTRTRLSVTLYIDCPFLLLKNIHDEHQLIGCYSVVFGMFRLSASDCPSVLCFV